MTKKQSIIFFFTCLLFSQIAGGIYSSQTIAEILSYQPALTGSLASFGYPHLYWPWSWWSWYFKYGEGAARWIFDKYGTSPALISLLGFAAFAMIYLIKHRPDSTKTHGSAHWATKKEMIDLGYDSDRRTLWEKLKKPKEFCRVLLGLEDGRHKNDNDLFGGKGVFLGYLDDGTYLRDNSKTHILCCAPTRSGKGVGHIIPTLLAWEGSVLVTDIKGENWELTSGYRKAFLGNSVFMFKPTHPDSCHYNPLDEIRIGTPYEMNDLQLVTKILVDPTGKGSEGNNAHWVNNAWDLLQGVVLHLLYAKRFHNGDNPRTANLSDVLDFLYDGQEGGTDRKVSPEDIEARNYSKAYNTNVVVSIPSVSDVKQSMEGKPPVMNNIAIYSPEKQYVQGFTDFDDSPGIDDDFLEEGAEFDSSSLSSYEEARNDALRSSDEAMSDVRSKPFDPDLANRIDIDKADEPFDEAAYRAEQERKAQEDKESESLSGLQKKFARYISNYNDTGKGFRHAPDGDDNFFVRLYPDKQNRDGLHPHVRQLFQSMVDKPDKEFGSILSTLNTALTLFRNPIIVNNIRESDFVMKDLMDCTKPISLYLVFGPGEMDVIRPLLRVIVEMIWRLNVEEMQFDDEGKAKAHTHRLLLLLDEFPALGKMDGLATSEGFIAGYGMKAMIITQDLNQINNIYGKDNYVVSNCQVQIYHTPSDNNSADYLSKKIGNATIKSTSSSRNSVLVPMPSSYNDSYTSRPLMYPNEVMEMDNAKLLVFCKGLAPIYCNKIRYFEDPEFSRRTKIKAPALSDTISPVERHWDIHDYHSLVMLKEAYEAKLKAEKGETASAEADEGKDSNVVQSGDIKASAVSSEPEKAEAAKSSMLVAADAGEASKA